MCLADDLSVVSLNSDRVASLNERSSRRGRCGGHSLPAIRAAKKNKAIPRRPQAARTYDSEPEMPGNDVKEKKRRENAPAGEIWELLRRGSGLPRRAHVIERGRQRRVSYAAVRASFAPPEPPVDAGGTDDSGPDVTADRPSTPIRPRRLCSTSPRLDRWGVQRQDATLTGRAVFAEPRIDHRHRGPVEVRRVQCLSRDLVCEHRRGGCRWTRPSPHHGVWGIVPARGGPGIARATV